MQTAAELSQKLEDLPLLPEVVVQLLKLNTNDDNYFDNVLTLAQKDPTFAIQIIRLSNSAKNAPVSPISSLEEAIARVGVDAVAGIITSMAVLKIFIPTTQGEKDLWNHSIQVAVMARQLCRLMPELNLDPDKAYLCGLLHDIGRFILFDKNASSFEKVEQLNWENSEQLIDAEHNIYGFDHSELGILICKKWGLPKSVSLIIQFHHEYSEHRSFNLSESNERFFVKLLSIIQLADSFSILILNQPELFTDESEGSVALVKRSCYRSVLTGITVSPKTLLELGPAFIKETSLLAAGLGISN